MPVEKGNDGGDQLIGFGFDHSERIGHADLMLAIFDRDEFSRHPDLLK